ncbi:FkbM family methyltransferase [Amycolatopsis sp. NPDC049252]|uniref:FkbM family methyltransferase n=1 Tax=Amycolatopsis sp. NPDC049252 TaxID=3363933 RepID=UPI00372351B7
MTPLRYVELETGFGCYVPQSTSGDTAEIGFIHDEIFHGNCYLQGGITLGEDAVVVDAGANVGLFSLYVKTRYPNARVLAIEPMPATYAALEANLGRHGCLGVTPLRAALGARAEPEVVFTYFEDLPGNSTRYPDLKAEVGRLPGTAAEREYRERLFATVREVRMPVEPLSDVLSRTGFTGPVDLLKIDVEGAEADVLAGIAETDWPRIRQVVLETQHDGPRLRALLGERGFTVTAARPEGVLAGLDTETVRAWR